MKKLIAFIMIFAVVGVGCFLGYRHVIKRDNNILKFSGELEMRRIDVSFRVPGQIMTNFFEEGALVKKDELLSELDPIEYETQLKYAQADESSAQWALTELNAGNTKEEVEQARKQLASAKTEEDRARKEYLRSKTLYESKSVSESEFDKVSTAYSVAQLRTGELAERLKLMETGPRKEKIEQAKAQLAATQSNVELAKQKVSFTKLYSPIDGVILDKYREQGEFTQAGSPVFSVGNPKELWMRAYLPETQAHMVYLGQKMAVTVDSLPDKQFEGVVTFISDKAEFTPKQIQTSIERVKLVYRIKIDIKETEGLLRPGIPADAVVLK